MTRQRLIGLAASLGTLGLCAVLIAAFLRWPVTTPALRAALTRQIEQTSGLTVLSSGAMSARLLPRPSVRVTQVAIAGLESAVSLDAAALVAHLDWPALLVGQVRLTGATLDRPTVAIDLDRLRPSLEALSGGGHVWSILSFLHTPGVSIRSGVIRLTSADPRRDTLMTDITADFAWPADDAEVMLSGSATWRGVAGAFDLDISRPDVLDKGGQSLASVMIRSPVLDMQAKGVIDGGGDLRATGTVQATTGDLPGFLHMIGRPAPQLGQVHSARVSGAVTMTADTLSFSDTMLTLSDMLFEGAIAVRQRGDRLSVAGTLATDAIDLDRFLGTLPPAVDARGSWSQARLATSAIAYDDVDLRVSAQSAKLGDLLIEDGSLSLQSGDGRLEMSVGEARAYDGLLKGRIVATVEGDETDVRAEATLSRLDLGAMMAGLPGGNHASGILTGHVALQGRGATPAALIDSLAGQGQLALHDGEIGGKLLGSFVQALPSATGSTLTLSRGSTPFDAAALAFTLHDGEATLGDSWIAWPSARAVLAGLASLPQQTLDMHVGVAHAEEPESEAEHYDLAGAWRDLRLNPTRPRS